MVDRTGLFVAPKPGTLAGGSAALPTYSTPPTGTSPTDGRLVLGALFGTGAGCLAGGGLAASATLMQVSVAQAVWRIPDPTNPAAVHLAPADAFIFALTAGPSSGSRIDLLWVRQNNFESGDADSRVTYGITTGIASSTPTPPALPAGAMQIARVNVPTGASNAAVCTLIPQFGGQSVLRPQLAAFTEAQLPAVGDYVGQLVYVAQVTVAGSTFPCFERWNGASWDRWSSDWVPYAPAVTNVGGSSNSAGFTWRYADGEVELRGYVQLGSGGGVGGDINMTLPVPAANAFTHDSLHNLRFLKSGTNFTFGVAAFVSSTAIYLRFMATGAATSGAPLVEYACSATAPFAWASGDGFQIRFRYSPA